MTPAANREKGRLSFLDCIRGIAAVAVLFEHAGERVSPHFRLFLHGSFDLGKFGVAAFFLTSGFVIPFSLERGNSLKGFWISRFFRLYPLYWLSLGLDVGFYFLGVANSVSSDFPAHLLRNTLVNITMFQEFFGVPDAEGLYYTLAMEMALYIFLSFLFLKHLQRFSLRFAWGFALLLVSAGVFVPLLAHHRIPMAGLFYVLCFLVGTCYYRHFTGELKGKDLGYLLGFASLASVAEVYCNYSIIKKADTTEQFTVWAVLLPWSVASLLFLASYLLRTRKFPQAFVYLGAISYSVYLLHPMVARLIPSGSHGTLSLLAVLAGTIALSSLTYRFIEQPFIRLGKKIQSRFADTRQITSAGTSPADETPAQSLGSPYRPISKIAT